MSDMFDWNGDGKLDSWEETNKVMFLYNQTHPKEQRISSSSGTDGKAGIGCGTVLMVLFILAVIGAIIR